MKQRADFIHSKTPYISTSGRACKQAGEPRSMDQ
jgi:hypothetical protein